MHFFNNGIGKGKNISSYLSGVNQVPIVRKVLLFTDN